MARPQSSELRRSGTTPVFEPDNIGSRLDARRQPGTSGETGPVPEDNLPGHRPGHDQDKPDLDEFAERLGIIPTDDDARSDDEAFAGAVDTTDAAVAPADPLDAVALAGAVAVAGPGVSVPARGRSGLVATALRLPGATTRFTMRLSAGALVLLGQTLSAVGHGILDAYDLPEANRDAAHPPSFDA